MNSNILYSSTINDYLGMDHTGTRLNTLANNFTDASSDMLREIAQAMINNDHTSWHSHLHTLKGIAGIAGAKNLHELCDTLRTNNKSTLLDDPNKILRQLQQAIDEYQDAIHLTLHPTIENKTKLC